MLPLLLCSFALAYLVVCVLLSLLTCLCLSELHVAMKVRNCAERLSGACIHSQLLSGKMTDVPDVNACAVGPTSLGGLIASICAKGPGS